MKFSDALDEIAIGVRTLVEVVAERDALAARVVELERELSHLVRLLEPLEEIGTLNIPGLATLNAARALLTKEPTP